MNRKDAIAWVLSVCAVSLRQSQAKTLAPLVHAAMFSRRISLANLGRHLRGQAKVKHRIKRVWRFIPNDRVALIAPNGETVQPADAWAPFTDDAVEQTVTWQGQADVIQPGWHAFSFHLDRAEVHSLRFGG